MSIIFKNRFIFRKMKGRTKEAAFNTRVLTLFVLLFIYEGIYMSIFPVKIWLWYSDKMEEIHQGYANITSPLHQNWNVRILPLKEMSAVTLHIFTKELCNVGESRDRMFDNYLLWCYFGSPTFTYAKIMFCYHSL